MGNSQSGVMMIRMMMTIMIETKDSCICLTNTTMYKRDLSIGMLGIVEFSEAEAA